MKLLLGTTNQAKIADYRKYLKHAGLELVTLKDIGFVEEPLEIGNTYLENALQKAKFYAEKTEYPTLADDGGFEVDALEGRPGIESSRWVGPNGTDEDRVQKVLNLLRGVPKDKRNARLKIIAVVYFPQERDHVSAEGLIEGTVSEKPSLIKVEGFPYRSILFLPQFNKYFIELTNEEYEKINHRKKICQELLMKLEPYLNA